MVRFALFTRRVPHGERGVFAVCAAGGPRRVEGGWLSFLDGPDGSCCADLLDEYAPDGAWGAVRCSKAVMRCA